MPSSSTSKERVYEKALSLILSLPEHYWVRMRADLDKASANSIIHKGQRVDTICLGDKKGIKG